MMWLTSLAFAGGLYAGDGLATRSISAIRKERKALVDELDEAELRLELLTASGVAETLSPKSERIWDATIIVLRDTLEQFEVGVERDMVLHADGSTVQTLQVRWDPGVLQVVQGRPQPPLLGPGPAASELEATFGVTLKGEWDPLARSVLRDALAVLTPQEQRAIRDLTIVRLDMPTVVEVGKEHSVAGQYIRGDELGPRIELYDRAIVPSMLFVGDPRAPKTRAVKTMVHELAHAIDGAPQRRLITAAAEVRKDIEATHAELTAQVAAGADAADLDALRAEHAEAVARLEALRASPWYGQGVGSSGFEEAVPDELAPTDYGRQSSAEGFAELYALARLDPEAAKRVCPKGAAWADSDALQARLEQALDEAEALAAPRP